MCKTAILIVQKGDINVCAKRYHMSDGTFLHSLIFFRYNFSFAERIQVTYGTFLHNQTKKITVIIDKR